jgi:hypothetical protein
MPAVLLLMSLHDDLSAESLKDMFRECEEKSGKWGIKLINTNEFMCYYSVAKFRDR